MFKSTSRGPRPIYFLKDGTPLIDAIAASGLKPVTVYSRIRRGASPDDALLPVCLPNGRPSVNFLKDGSPLADAIRKNGVCQRAVYRFVQRGLSPDAALVAASGSIRRSAGPGRSVGTGRPVRPG